MYYIIFSDIMTVTQRQTDPVRDELHTAIAKVEKVLISEKGKITSFGTSINLRKKILNYVKLIS